MKYLVEVFWSDDDEGYVAVVPDLSGCSAVSETPEVAVHEIGDAADAWIAACRASGNPAPEPTTRPVPRDHALSQKVDRDTSDFHEGV